MERWIASKMSPKRSSSDRLTPPPHRRDPSLTPHGAIGGGNDINPDAQEFGEFLRDARDPKQFVASAQPKVIRAPSVHSPTVAERQQRAPAVSSFTKPARRHDPSPFVSVPCRWLITDASSV